jgi:hypothetical protein
MTQQITRTLSVRIWADKGRRLPPDCEGLLDAGFARAVEQIEAGYTSGEIVCEDTSARGWWGVNTSDER